MVDYSKRCVRCNGEWGHTSSSCIKPYYETMKLVDTFTFVAYDLSGNDSDTESSCLSIQKMANGFVIDSWLEHDRFTLQRNVSDGKEYWVNKYLTKVYLRK